MRLIAFKSALAAIVITTAALGAHAKAQTMLNVPFTFTVAGQNLPAGVYTVYQDNIHNTVLFRNQAATRSFSYVLRPGEWTPNDARVALKFENSGDTHILRSIEVGSKTTPRLDDGPAPAAFEPGRLSQGR